MLLVVLGTTDRSGENMLEPDDARKAAGTLVIMEIKIVSPDYFLAPFSGAEQIF